MLNTIISILKSKVPMQSGKKFLASVFVLCLLVCSNASAQIPDHVDPGKFPMDVSTRLISYIEVVPVPGVETKEMMARGLKWFNTYYKNPSDVIREVDSLRGKISGKARFKIYKPSYQKEVKMDGGNVEYTISVNLKDGRYRYIVTDINWKQASYFPVERWLDTTAKGYVKEYYPSYLEQMDTQIHEVLKNLETHMKTSPAKKNDDW